MNCSTTNTFSLFMSLLSDRYNKPLHSTRYPLSINKMPKNNVLMIMRFNWYNFKISRLQNYFQQQNKKWVSFFSKTAFKSNDEWL